MKTKNNLRDAQSGTAFTRLELGAVLAGLALLFALILPAIANTRGRAERLVCVSNLGEIGKGYNLWASEHGDLYPFMVATAEGGIRQPHNGLQVNSWYQFAWISNELSSARVLACPSDATRRPAADFSSGPGGLLHSIQRNNSISYFLTYPFYPSALSVLSGDRNIIAESYANGCSVFGPNSVAAFQNNFTQATVSWSGAIHSQSGNLLLRDGAVDETQTAELRRRFVPNLDNGSVHLLLP